MVAKYFVWADGVWRSVDVASGRISGWRRHARFVYVRRGRLLLARRRPVLRALEALATGQPSSAADGPRLSHRKKHEHPPPPAPAPPPAACAHRHCCAHNGYAHLPAPPAHGSRDAGTCTERTHAYTINVQPAHKPAPAARSAPDSADEFVTKPARCSTIEVNALLSQQTSVVAPASTARKPTDAPPAPERGVCKELLVSEADVAALRGFVARTRASALSRFDADDSYKRALFYAINPLVELERCARLELLLSERVHFAALLGLAPRSASTEPEPASSAPPSSAPLSSAPSASARARRRKRSRSADTDKENKDKRSTNKVQSEPDGTMRKTELRGAPAAGESAPAAELAVSKRRNNVQQETVMRAPDSSGIGPHAPRPKRAPERCKQHKPAGTHVISKRASQTKAKEYSNLEDHAIVAWISNGSRASFVNGNRVWRDLQEQYERLTGCARTWHSLRNRYLRYILPALGALHLPPALVSRLRAAAAAGAIKKPREAGARHSMFQPPVRGASSRLVRSHSSSDVPDPGPARPPRRSLRARRLDSSSKDESSKEAASKASVGKEPASKASDSKGPASKAGRSPRYSEVTRRFAARRRVVSSGSASPAPPASRTASPAPPGSRSPSPVTPRLRSRRLFNPNTNV